MPVIVKWRYVPDLLAALAEADAVGMTDTEFVVDMNAPVPTGAVEVVPVEADIADVLTAFVGAKDFADAQAQFAHLPLTEERPVLGPSKAQVIGIGEIFEGKNMEQLRAYQGEPEQAVREDLAKLSLLRCLRQILSEGLTVEAYIAEDPPKDEELNRWQVRLQTIADYTGVTDEARLRALLDELVALAEAERLTEEAVI